MIKQQEAKFLPKKFVITAAAHDALIELSDGGDHVSNLHAQILDRHLSGDWGDVDFEDKKANDRALTGNQRVMSSFKYDDLVIWVITEWDRSVCTVLLPRDY
jgi:hypothetical protein